MPRRIRSAELETRSARLRLKVRKKPYALQVGPGIHLLYRRNKKAGAWVVKAAGGKGRYWTEAFGRFRGRKRRRYPGFLAGRGACPGRCPPRLGG